MDTNARSTLLEQHGELFLHFNVNKPTQKVVLLPSFSFIRKNYKRKLDNYVSKSSVWSIH